MIRIISFLVIAFLSLFVSCCLLLYKFCWHFLLLPFAVFCYLLLSVVLRSFITLSREQRHFPFAVNSGNQWNSMVNMKCRHGFWQWKAKEHFKWTHLLCLCSLHDCQGEICALLSHAARGMHVCQRKDKKRLGRGEKCPASPTKCIGKFCHIKTPTIIARWRIGRVKSRRKTFVQQSLVDACSRVTIRPLCITRFHRALCCAHAFILPLNLSEVHVRIVHIVLQIHPVFTRCGSWKGRKEKKRGKKKRHYEGRSEADHIRPYPKMSGKWKMEQKRKWREIGIIGREREKRWEEEIWGEGKQRKGG